MAWKLVSVNWEPLFSTMIFRHPNMHMMSFHTNFLLPIRPPTCVCAPTYSGLVKPCFEYRDFIWYMFSMCNECIGVSGAKVTQLWCVCLLATYLHLPSSVLVCYFSTYHSLYHCRCRYSVTVKIFVSLFCAAVWKLRSLVGLYCKFSNLRCFFLKSEKWSISI